MESDTLSDDMVEKKTFDLSNLKLDEVFKKTFVFREVQCTLAQPRPQGLLGFQNPGDPGDEVVPQLTCQVYSVTAFVQHNVTLRDGISPIIKHFYCQLILIFDFFFQTSEIDVEMKVKTW